MVCQQCHESAPRCTVCGIPLGADHLHLSDGRDLCARCARTAVTDPAQAQVLFARVATLLTDTLGLGLNIGASLQLVDDPQWQTLLAETAPAVQDEADKIVGLFIRQGRRRLMAILSGLPQILFIQTVAHEWAHVWQGENCPLLRNPLIREGFAEWVAYRALKALGAVKKAALMEQRTGLYGDGLRAMLQLEAEQGASGVLAFCRKSE